MRKKFIIGLMISGLAMSVVACGGNEIEKEIGNGIETAIVENDEAMLEETVIEDTEEIEEETEEETLDGYEEQGVILYEKNLYYDEEITEFVSDIQGSIKGYDIDYMISSVLVDNEIYQLHGWYLESPISPETNVDSFRIINNIDVGICALISHTDNTISLYKEANGSAGVEEIFRGITLNTEEYLFEIHSGDRFSVLKIEENNFTMLNFYTDPSYIEDDYDNYKERYGDALYEITNAFGEKYYVIEETINNTIANLSNYEEIDISNSKICVKESKTGDGYAFYCITSNNEVYEISTCTGQKFEFASKEPIITDVEQLYHSSGLITRLNVPIYSKAGDNNHLYTTVYGESRIDREDDKTVTFEMPDNYTVADIKKMRAGKDLILVEFISGDIYMTEEIDTNTEKVYTFTKVEELSNLNDVGEIVEFQGNYEVDEIYILMDNNKLYVYEY